MLNLDFNFNIIYGIDPGPQSSALVIINRTFGVIHHMYGLNIEIEKYLEEGGYGIDLNKVINCEDILAIEYVQSYGGEAGDSLFRTAKQCGRFEKAWELGGFKVKDLFLFTRPPIRSWITGHKRGKVRGALIERLGSSKQGGPLAGIVTHRWDALAIAVYLLDGMKLAESKDKSLMDLGWINRR